MSIRIEMVEVSLHKKTSLQRKKRIFDIIQIGQREDFISRAFDFFIVIVIILNIAVMFMETFEELAPYYPILRTTEMITIAIFCLEYMLRIWTSEFLYPQVSKKKAALKFLISFDGIVDLLTILPFFFLSGFIAFRMLRVVRIFHLFRINAYYDSFNVITSVLNEKKNQIISSVFIVFILMMCSSLCMYSAEHEAQPDIFNNAFSGMWWSISTILTVGYGDIYPITVLGRIMAIIIALLGVGVVAIPTGIISAGFVEHYTKIQQKCQQDLRAEGTATVLIQKTSTFYGKTLEEIAEKYNVHILVVVRDGAVLMATPSLQLTTGDTVVYQDIIVS